MTRIPDRLPRQTAHGRLLVVDDDRRMASDTARWLCGMGWHASAVGSAKEAVAMVTREAFDACILDGLLPEGGAERVAGALRASAPFAGLVIAIPPAEPAASSADAVVHSPIRDDDLLAAVEAAIAAGNRRRTAAGSARCGGDRAPSDRLASPILGTSPAIRRVLELAGRLADAPATLLVTGESGTGKSLLARELHRMSRRRAGPFVEVACGSLSESLLESELFGHVAGAFTGATADRDGKFLQADGGTIFLDEIATASPAMQVKLLRVLQDLRFEAVGGSRTQEVDVRVILATNEDLGTLVADGRFRADLFWRVNVVTIEMPPLRERAEDISLLAGHFLAAAMARGGRSVEGFSPAAVAALAGHRWPGNIRELQHAVEFALLLGNAPWIEAADLPPAVRNGGLPDRAGVAVGAGSAAVPAAARAVGSSDATASLKGALAHPERRLIIEALERHGWRRDAAARALGINRTTLYKKLKRLGLDLSSLEPLPVPAASG